MAGCSDTTEAAILNLIFRAIPWANYADNAAGTPETTIAVALHTADPTDALAMNNVEAGYGGYARGSVARSAAGWNAAAPDSTAHAVTLVANLDFAVSTGAGTTLTNFSTGKSGGGAAPILWSGGISPSIAIPGTGVTPRLTTATKCTLD